MLPSRKNHSSYMQGIHPVIVTGAVTVTGAEIENINHIKIFLKTEKHKNQPN